MSYLQSVSVFLTVAEEGSFSAAAKKLALTQPTVSFHIDNLEKRFGCPLFTRTAKGVILTVYGKTLYDQTLMLQEIVGQAENQVRLLVKGSHGHVTVGASTVPAEYILPRIIADFLAECPDVTFALEAGDSSSVLHKFQQGLIPLAIVGCRPEAPLAGVPIWQDELVLVAHPDFPLALTAAGELKLQQLTQYPLIMREPSSGSRKTVIQALTEHDIAITALQIAVETGGNEACKSLIRKRAGIGFLSKWTVEQDINSGNLRRIPVIGLDLRRTFYVLHNPDLQPTCVETFRQFMLSHTQPL